MDTVNDVIFSDTLFLQVSKFQVILGDFSLASSIQNRSDISVNKYFTQILNLRGCHLAK